MAALTPSVAIPAPAAAYPIGLFTSGANFLVSGWNERNKSCSVLASKESSRAMYGWFISSLSDGLKLWSYYRHELRNESPCSENFSVLGK